MTLIKQAITSDSTTVLSLARSTRRSPNGFQEAVFFVDLTQSGKLIGRTAHMNVADAFKQFSQLLEDGAIHNGYDFAPMPENESYESDPRD